MEVATRQPLPAASVLVAEEALSQVFGAITSTDKRMTQELRKTAGAAHELLEGLTEHNRKLEDRVASLEGRVAGLEEDLGRSEKVRGAEREALMQRIAVLERAVLGTAAAAPPSAPVPQVSPSEDAARLNDAIARLQAQTTSLMAAVGRK